MTTRNDIWKLCFRAHIQRCHNWAIVLTIRWPCVRVQVCWWMWWMNWSWAQRWDGFKVQAGKARLGAACTRLRNLILFRLLLFFSCLGFLPKNKQRDLWRDWLHMEERTFLESVKRKVSGFVSKGSILLFWKHAIPCIYTDKMVILKHKIHTYTYRHIQQKYSHFDECTEGQF